MIDSLVKKPALITLCLLVADEGWEVFPAEIGNWVRISFYVISFFLIARNKE